jgi:hypothetical protein
VDDKVRHGMQKIRDLHYYFLNILTTKQKTCVAEPHNFYAAPAPGKNFDAAPAPTLLNSKAKF